MAKHRTHSLAFKHQIVQEYEARIAALERLVGKHALCSSSSQGGATAGATSEARADVLHNSPEGRRPGDEPHRDPLLHVPHQGTGGVAITF